MREQALDLAADHQADDALDVELGDGARCRPGAPSRSTVTRSQICITSSSRWVTKMTEMPLALSPRTMANSRWTSLSDRAEVGSSMTTSLAVHRQRARDLDHLLLGDRQVGDQPARVDVEPDLRGERLRAPMQLAQSTRPSRTGSRPMNTFSATDSVGTRLNSW